MSCPSCAALAPKSCWRHVPRKVEALWVRPGPNGEMLVGILVVPGIVKILEVRDGEARVWNGPPPRGTGLDYAGSAVVV